MTNKQHDPDYWLNKNPAHESEMTRLQLLNRIIYEDGELEYFMDIPGMDHRLSRDPDLAIARHIAASIYESRSALRKMRLRMRLERHSFREDKGVA